jgi:outer membrane protein TolC
VRRFAIFTTLVMAVLWLGAGSSSPAQPPAQDLPVVAPPLPPPRSEMPPLTKPPTPSPGDHPAPPSLSPPNPLPATNGEPGTLPPAPLEVTDAPLPITLAAALQLADARPTVVLMAQAAAWTAEAHLQWARTLWLPQLNFGGCFVRHDGFGPDFNRGLNTDLRPLNNNINFLYAGGGALYQNPGVEVIYTAIVSRQLLNARRWDIQKAKNDALLDTARAYFDVHRYRGTYAGALDTVQRGVKLVERVERLSKDLVPRAEVDRARRALADLEQMATSARENWRVSSANLTEVLRLDPRVVIVPQEHDHLQVTLVDPKCSLDELIPIGLTNRPELASQQAFIQAILTRIRREKLRAFVPTFQLWGFQTPGELINGGVQGIGSDGSMNLWSAREDWAPQLLWQLDGLGLGNLARIKEQRGEQSRAIVDMFRLQDRIAREVVQAQARMQSAAARVLQAERSLREAIITYEKNYEGLRQTTRFGNVLVQAYRPQEAVRALEDLKNSYDEYFMTVADYNRQQFEMYHALGYPSQDVAAKHPPGPSIPVDTSRPGYLPATGIGPPPATR